MSAPTYPKGKHAHNQAMHISYLRRLAPAIISLTVVVLCFYYFSGRPASQHTAHNNQRTAAAGTAGVRYQKIQQGIKQEPEKAEKPKSFFPNPSDYIPWLKFSENEEKENERGELPTFNVEDVERKYPPLNLGGDHKHDKWIVLTTIQMPTEDVKFLAGLKDWRVVVVGDTKTPKEWSWPNCHYISVEFQEKMGLRLASHLEYRTYHRKNAGYLYAIAHGAKVVYETDDDNRPFDSLTSFQYSKNVSGLMFAGSKLFNAYQYFGQSTLWQRGFPLGNIGDKVENTFRVSREWDTPVVQQGVVNGDPDVDAIFRLTRKYSYSKLDVSFDPAGPPVLVPPGVFSPTNTQNTLLLYDALWSLFIPTSLNFRTCDIWRGYIAQRLLWETGKYQAYYPPNAVQVRNNHDLVDDMSMEDQMYFTTRQLLDFLYAWRCQKDLTFFQCVYKLMEDLVDHGDFIFVSKDVETTRIWLEDIIVLGYQEPKRIHFENEADNVEIEVDMGSREELIAKGDAENGGGEGLEKLKSKILEKGTPVFYAPAEQIEPTIMWQPRKETPASWKYAQKVVSNCPKVQSIPSEFVSGKQKVYDVFHDVLLIIYINPVASPAPTNHYANIVKNMEFYYRAMFPNMVFCGHDSATFLKEAESLKLNNRQTFIELSADSVSSSTGKVLCTTKALQMNYKVAGYLTIEDDVILDLSPMRDLKKDKVWMTSQSTQKSSATISGKTQYDTAINALSAMGNSNLPKDVHPASGFVDNIKKQTQVPTLEGSGIFYVPKSLRVSAEFYFSHFTNNKVASSISIPAVLQGLYDGANLAQSSRQDGFFKLGMRGDISKPCGFLQDEIDKLTKKNTPAVTQNLLTAYQKVQTPKQNTLTQSQSLPSSNKSTK